MARAQRHAGSRWSNRVAHLRPEPGRTAPFYISSSVHAGGTQVTPLFSLFSLYFARGAYNCQWIYRKGQLLLDAKRTIARLLVPDDTAQRQNGRVIYAGRARCSAIFQTLQNHVSCVIALLGPVLLQLVQASN
jgi:hypothetical protein